MDYLSAPYEIVTQKANQRAHDHVTEDTSFLEHLVN